jgi:hypothetical protein
VPIGAGGRIGAPQKVVLGGDWVRSSVGSNANGIDVTPDGRHLIVGQTQAADGHSALHLVPTGTASVAAARRITVHGTNVGNPNAVFKVGWPFPNREATIQPASAMPMRAGCVMRGVVLGAPWVTAVFL